MGTLDLRDLAQMNEVYDLFQNCKLFDPTKQPEVPKPVKKAEPMDVEKPEGDAGEGENADAAAAEDEPMEEWDDDMDDLLSRIKAEKAAKGLDTLNMKELQGLTKEEKIAMLEEKRAKFRKQKE